MIENSLYKSAVKNCIHNIFGTKSFIFEKFWVTKPLQNLLICKITYMYKDHIDGWIKIVFFIICEKMKM